MSRALLGGGLLLGEIITRYAWVLDATRHGLLGRVAAGCQRHVIGVAGR